MTLPAGRTSERWSAARGLEALGEAARRAGTPGLIWLVGVTYPGLNLSVELVRGVLGVLERATGIPMPGSTSAGDMLFLFGPEGLRVEDSSLLRVGAYALVLLPLYLVVYRLIVGLAKACDPGPPGVAPPGEVEGTGDALAPPSPPTLGAAWRAGRGLGGPACGMWFLLFALLLGVTLFLVGPLVTLVHILGLETLNPLLVGLIVPLLLLVLAYATILQVLNQLGLQSLAHNRRGVASALTHAWRLVRGSPWSAAGAMLIDFGLFLAVLGTSRAVERVLAGDGLLQRPLAQLLVLALYGFVGVTRAGFWARAYRALGGLSADDLVPGLEPSAGASSPWGADGPGDASGPGGPGVGGGERTRA